MIIRRLPLNGSLLSLKLFPVAWMSEPCSRIAPFLYISMPASHDQKDNKENKYYPYKDCQAASCLHNTLLISLSIWEYFP
jgi:hypothetical protein